MDENLRKEGKEKMHHNSAKDKLLSPAQKRDSWLEIQAGIEE